MVSASLGLRTSQPPNSTETAFSWAQLESNDYPTYIKNLRAIGCPEQTIRDIVTADVHSLYKQRRTHLEQSVTGTQADSASQTREIPNRKLQELRDEEGSLLAILLGPEATFDERGSEKPLPARSSRGDRGSSAISLPLVLQNVDPKSLNLNPTQIEAITELREQFIHEIGGSNQDPHDPGYRERWRQSQPHIDEMLRGIIGINAYEDYQLAGWSAPAGESLPTGAHPSGQ